MLHSQLPSISGVTVVSYFRILWSHERLDLVAFRSWGFYNGAYLSALDYALISNS
jgi:hypothetical protein